MTRNSFQHKLLLLFFAAFALVRFCRAAPDEATITYRRVFKGSSPEFIEIKIAEQARLHSTFVNSKRIRGRAV